MALSFSSRVVTRNNTTPPSPSRVNTAYASDEMRTLSVVPSIIHANRSGSSKRNQASAFLGCFTARSQCGQINTVRLRYHACLPLATRTRSRGVSFSHHGHFHLGHMPSNVRGHRADGTVIATRRDASEAPGEPRC